jgi:hypothetical protein
LRSKARSLYFSRNEKLSRNNKRLLYSDGRNCPSVFLDLLRIGFVPAHREPFSEEWAIYMRRRTLKALESISKENNMEIIVPEESLTPKGLMRDDSDAEKVIELFKTKDLAGILIGTMTFGEEIPAITIAEKMPEMPVLLFGTKEGAFTEAWYLFSGRGYIQSRYQGFCENLCRCQRLHGSEDRSDRTKTSAI